MARGGASTPIGHEAVVGSPGFDAVSGTAGSISTSATIYPLDATRGTVGTTGDSEITDATSSTVTGDWSRQIKGMALNHTSQLLAVTQASNIQTLD